MMKSTGTKSMLSCPTTFRVQAVLALEKRAEM
jgi:hypothetical protein